MSKGTIIWIDEECCGYKCACGKEIVVNIYGVKCPGCYTSLRLKQVNEVINAEGELLFIPPIAKGIEAELEGTLKDKE